MVPRKGCRPGGYRACSYTSASGCQHDLILLIRRMLVVCCQSTGGTGDRAATHQLSTRGRGCDEESRSGDRPAATVTGARQSQASQLAVARIKARR